MVGILGSSEDLASSKRFSHFFSLGVSVPSSCSSSENDGFPVVA